MLNRLADLTAVVEYRVERSHRLPGISIAIAGAADSAISASLTSPDQRPQTGLAVVTCGRRAGSSRIIESTPRFCRSQFADDTIQLAGVAITYAVELREPRLWSEDEVWRCPDLFSK